MLREVDGQMRVGCQWEGEGQMRRGADESRMRSVEGQMRVGCHGERGK